MIITILATALLSSCSVTDGDTIRCGDERIRLLGIDAPELSRCPARRQCVEGDGAASKRSLEGMTRGAQLTIERVGKDHYGRTLGIVYANGRNTSCAQIQGGQAEYIKRWDNGGRVAAECPAWARN